MTNPAPLTADELELVGFAGELASVFAREAPDRFGSLTPQQRKFAALYVLMQGNATKAAQGADYKNPSVIGCRLMCHPVVSELVRLLSLADASAALPIAIATLSEIAQDKKAKPELRRNAALDLAKIGGAMPKAGPSTAIQINQGGDGKADPAGGSSPSIVIQNVWSNRDARLSSIAPPMLDSPDTIDTTADDDDATAAA